MWPGERQKIYLSEEQRRKDQKQNNQPKMGLLEAFNEWASEKSGTYRRDAQRAAATLEFQIEDGLKQSDDEGLKEKWQKNLDSLSEARIALKIGACDNVAKECLKANKIYTQVEKLQKVNPFNAEIK